MKKTFSYRKIGRQLVAVAVAIVGFGASQVGFADTWQANSPDQIQIAEGATEYTLKRGDTLWAVSQKIGKSVEYLAKINSIDFSLGEETRLEVGRVIFLTEPQPQSEVVADTSSGEKQSEVVADTSSDEKQSEVVADTSSDEKQSEVVADTSSGEKQSEVVADTSSDEKQSEVVADTSSDEKQSEVVVDTSSEDEVSSSTGAEAKSESKLDRAVKTVVFRGSVLSGKNSEGDKVVLNEVLDLAKHRIQSFYVENGRYYILNDFDSDVVLFDEDGTKLESISKGYTGHSNDVAVAGNLKYIAPGGTKIYVWNTEDDSIAEVDLTDVATYALENDTRVDVGGVTLSTDDQNVLYLVGLDKYATTAIEREKGANIVVFSHDLNSGKQEFLFRDELDYIGLLQGATEHNGVLYVAQNHQTDNYNLSDYTGISVKAYDLNSHERIEEYVIEGKLEPEGIQVIQRQDCSQEVAFGVLGESYSKILSIPTLEVNLESDLIVSESLEDNNNNNSEEE